jgi:hypothetical protein
MKHLSLIITTLLLLSACGSNGETQEHEFEDFRDQFFANVSQLCGTSFVGESTFPDDPDHPLVDTELRVHVHTCEEDVIKVDLIRDGDTWHATWVLEMREEGLHLYHDHIGDKEYAEGEEPLTGYGGYANEYGSGYLQYFPADDYTAEILPEAATNVWMMEYDPAAETFTYYLERHGEPRFRAVVMKQS